MENQKNHGNQDFRSTVEEFVRNNYASSAPGMNVLVNLHGKTNILFSVGSIPELNFKFSEDTLFDVASLTKPIATATSVMISVEKGLISLEDTLETLGLYKSEEAVSTITVRNLLNHTSGLLPSFPLYNFGKTREDYTRTISLLHNRIHIGVTEEYSDLNFILLGFLLEHVYSKNLDKIAEDLIFKPLGMRNSTFNPVGDKMNIAPTEVDELRGTVWGVVHDEKAYYLGGVAGHAGLFSTVGDLGIFLKELLNGNVLKRNSFEVMTGNTNSSLGGMFGYGWMTKTKRPSNPSPSFGYSGFMGDLASEGTFGHTGFTGCSVCVDPGSNSFVIIMSDRTYPTRNNNSILRFRRLFHNLAFAHSYSL